MIITNQIESSNDLEELSSTIGLAKTDDCQKFLMVSAAETHPVEITGVNFAIAQTTCAHWPRSCDRETTSQKKACTHWPAVPNSFRRSAMVRTHWQRQETAKRNCASREQMWCDEVHSLAHQVWMPVKCGAMRCTHWRIRFGCRRNVVRRGALTGASGWMPEKCVVQ